MDELENYDDDTVTTPPLRLADIAALMQEMAQAGWVWEEKTSTLTHPQDRDLFFIIDPATRRPTLSAKLAQRLADGLGPHEARP